MTMKLVIAALLASAVALPSVAAAQEWIVIFDTNPDSIDGKGRAASIIAANAETDRGNTLKSILAGTTDPAQKLSDIRTAAKDWEPATRKRWTGSGKVSTRVVIFSKDSASQWELRVAEKERTSRLSMDAALLSRIALQVILGPARGLAYRAGDAVAMQDTVIQLEKERATVTFAAVKVSSRGVPAGSFVAVCAAGGSMATCRDTVRITPQTAVPRDSLGITVATGPAERVFLSAAAPVVARGDLQLESDTGTVVLADSPGGFSIGLNITAGDMSAGDEEQNFFRGLFLGVTIQASRHPFDEVGLIAGMRHNPIPGLNDLFPFETIAPYGGVQWVRAEDPDAENERKWSRGRAIFGVALNLGEAVGWLQPED